MATSKTIHVFSSASILNIKWLPLDPRLSSLTPYQAALHLYDKYVEENADLCINISFEIRKTIYRYFQELSQQQNNASFHDIKVRIETGKSGEIQFDDNNAMVRMYKIYDEAFTEVWRLIQTDSFVRFRSM